MQHQAVSPAPPRAGLPSGSTEREEDEVFLTLTVAGQGCAVPVLLVRDVLGPQAITRIPLAPAEVAGSLNLRGRIVTAVDLRLRLGLPPRESGAAPMSVVVEQAAELYSLQVDEVGEVVPLPAAGFEPNPPTLDASWRDVSRGVHRQENRLVIALDVDRVLAIG
ncbi:chemotaxis protein CheW [Roseomonas eburnea]|uniref:Chemotaxis protein CheW n=1 Tax=Neoroseomonas eburnea TaxID=1346889 RepID=A0A9X9XJR8_9PROT|nr:chemotaxis protein CheW [Neoroseomonas eburnea]MBR0683954.1 chemotaxis protein CheW [Neoroseomonas eburnea]